MNHQRAVRSGEIKLGFATIPCAVLSDGTRLITLTGLAHALERARPEGGTKNLGEVLPYFLRSSNLKPFISNDLTSSSSPIVFYLPKGGKAYGYKAEILPKICEVYLNAEEAGALKKDQFKSAIAAKMIIRALAHTGIIALVDEATGYQELRDKHALQAILDRYLQKEQAAWAKRFPDEFYSHIFRLRNWKPQEVFKHKPTVVAKYTNDLVYERICPGMLSELQKINPIDPLIKKRKGYHHNHLTPLEGMPALSLHMHALLRIMRGCNSWDEFMKMTDKFLPKQQFIDIKVN